MHPRSTQTINFQPNGPPNSSVKMNQHIAETAVQKNISGNKRYSQPNAMYPMQQNVLHHVAASYGTPIPYLQHVPFLPQFYPHAQYYPYVNMNVQQRRRVAAGPIGRTDATGSVPMLPITSSSYSASNIHQGQMPLFAPPLAGGAMFNVFNPMVTPSATVAPLAGIRENALRQQPQSPAPNKRKDRSHAIKIINPITNRNILDDLNTNNKNDSPEITSEDASSSINSIVDRDNSSSCIASNNPELKLKSMEMNTHNIGKTENDIIKYGTDVPITAGTNSGSVQKSTSKHFFNDQFEPEQDNTKSKTSIYEENCVKDNFSVDDQEKHINCNTENSPHIMSLEINENITATPNNHEYQLRQQELEHRNSNCLSLIILNNATTIAESVESNNNNNDLDGNNNNEKNINFSENNFPMNAAAKQRGKFDKKKRVRNISGKTKNASTEANNKTKQNKCSNNNAAIINGDARNEAHINITSPEDELFRKEIVVNSSTNVSSVTTECEAAADTEITGKDENNARRVKKTKNITAGSIAKADNATAHNELVMAVKKQYNREELMRLREEKASLLQPVAQNKSMFSLICSSGRSDADRDQSSKPIICLNLSLNQDVKLKEADNAWRPKMLTECTDTEENPEQREKNELLRRVRGILNKLTPEKFEQLLDEVLKLDIDTLDKVEAVMVLVFEKAIDEPNFSVSYAKLCHRLINEVQCGGKGNESGPKINVASFRNALVKKIEKEFTQNVIRNNTKEEKLKDIKENISNCKDENEKLELETLLDEEERKIRRRYGGTVRFIGELFMISILTGNIINYCIDALLKYPNNEDMLECLCKLLTTVGRKFEQTNINKKDTKKYSLQGVIKRMKRISGRDNSKISSRVRFMLKDVIELREKNWVLTRNEVPKTMDQIEKDAQNEELNNRYECMNSLPSASVSIKSDDRHNSNAKSNYGGSHGQRSENGNFKRQQDRIGNDAHNNFTKDDVWQIQTGKGSRSLIFDSNKLIGMAVDMHNKKMGDAARYQWNRATTQPISTSSNSFAALSIDSNRMDRNQSGPHNKGSYSKLNAKRDSSAHASRENSCTTNTDTHGVSSSKKTLLTTGYTLKTSQIHHQQQQQQQQQNVNKFENALSHPTSVASLVFEEPTESDLALAKTVVIDMVENAMNSKRIDRNTVSCIKELRKNQLCGLLFYILTEYLHLRNVDPLCRRKLANIVAYLITTKYITIEHFRLAYKHFFEGVSDLMLDVPELWLYVFEFTGPLFVKQLITLDDLWNTQVPENSPPDFGKTFLQNFLQYCLRQVGPTFTRNMWKIHHVKWTSFMTPIEVMDFILRNKFEFVEKENCPPYIDNKETKEKLVNRMVLHIEQLLKEGCTADDIIDYINGNITDVDNVFINSLVKTLINYAVNNDYSLNLTYFQEICAPVLLRYLNHKKELELECLTTIESLDRNMQHPKGLLEAIFGELKAARIISQDMLKTWRGPL